MVGTVLWYGGGNENNWLRKHLTILHITFQLVPRTFNIWLPSLQLNMGIFLCSLELRDVAIGTFDILVGNHPPFKVGLRFTKWLTRR